MYVGQIVTVVDHQNGPEEAAIVIRLKVPGEPEDHVHLQVFGHAGMYRLNAGPRDETYGVGYKVVGPDMRSFGTLTEYVSSPPVLVPVGDENARAAPAVLVGESGVGGGGFNPDAATRSTRTYEDYKPFVIDEMVPFDTSTYDSAMREIAAKSRIDKLEPVRNGDDALKASLDKSVTFFSTPPSDELARLRNSDGSIDTQKAVAEEAAVIEAETGFKTTAALTAEPYQPPAGTYSNLFSPLQEEAVVAAKETAMALTASQRSDADELRKTNHKQIDTEVAARKASARKANEEMEKARAKPKQS